jgi:hypothetical protein
MSEVYYSGDIARTAYAHDAQPPELYAQLQEKFPWVKPEQCFSISEPSMHEVLNEPVITCNLPYPTSAILGGPDAAMAARKFCMDSGTSFLRLYKLPTEPNPSWMPSQANLMLVGENFEEFGRPFNPLCKTFKDYYFGGNPEVIEAHFNLINRRGSYDTWYGATVVDGQVVRVKQYCYEEQSAFSDWEVAFIGLCKRHNRLDLL